jgi:hypothetical protein
MKQQNEPNPIFLADSCIGVIGYSLLQPTELDAKSSDILGFLCDHYFQIWSRNDETRVDDTALFAAAILRRIPNSVVSNPSRAFSS